MGNRRFKQFPQKPYKRCKSRNRGYSKKNYPQWGEVRLSVLLIGNFEVESGFVLLVHFFQTGLPSAALMFIFGFKKYLITAVGSINRTMSSLFLYASGASSSVSRFAVVV